ncbi:MAG: HlyD family secretion protein [Bacteroidales bacterium]
MKFNRRHILLIILFCLLFAFFLPIKVHYSFESTAIVFPLKEWHLTRITDDALISELVDNQTNFSSHLKNYKFERSDISQIHFKDFLRSGVFVNSGDTLAYIHTFYLRNEITRLKNLKKTEEKNLLVNITGEKQELIDQAYNQYQLAKQQLNYDKKNFERYQDLVKDSIISPSEFEIFENTLHLSEINVQIAYHEWISLKAGSKPEEIDYIREMIDSYGREIKALEEQLEQYYIISPIDGVVGFDRVLNSVISVTDTSGYVLKIPVQVKNIRHLPNISSIRFSNSDRTVIQNAIFLGLEEKMSILGSQQMAVAKALVDGGHNALHSGMAVKCRIYCDRITLYELFKRGISLNI